MKKIVASLLGIAAPLLLAAQIRITHGPWLCDMTSTGVTVVWTTDKPALSWVEVAEDQGKSFYQTEHNRHYETVAGRRQAHKTLHTIRLEGLRPGTRYCYRIFSREVVKWKYYDAVKYGDIAATNVFSRAPLRFTTFPEKGSDVSFVILNDIHGRADYMSELLQGEDFRTHDFVVFNGDMSNSVESREQLFKDYIDTAVKLHASELPVMYNRGNHETRGCHADFLPEYFPTRSGRFYQLYMVGDVAFLVLDCGEDKPDTDIEYGGLADYDAYRLEECEWLREAVSSEAFRHAAARIVFLHIPLGSGDWHGNLHLDELFLPILNEAGIDVMFSGHTHRYGFRDADQKVRFPVLINDNQSFVRCDVTAERIRAEIVGPEGTTHTHEFRIRRKD